MKHTFTTIKQILLGTILVAGSGMAHASWGEPGAIPPLANVAPVVHTGNDQVKDGDLGIGAALSAVLNAAFKQETTLGGTLIGRFENGKNVVVFGDTTKGYDVDVLSSGAVRVDGTIAASNIANTSTKHICADTTGKIVTCDASQGGDDPCPGKHNFNGTCTPTVVIDASGYPGASIVNVTGIANFTFAHPLTPTDRVQTGYHNEFNGQITIKATGPTNSGLYYRLETYIDGQYPLNCFNLVPGVTNTYVTDYYQYVGPPSSSTANEIDITIDANVSHGC